MNQQLIDMIQAQAKQSHSEIISNAEAEARTILDSAAEKAEEMRTRAHLRVQAEADRIRERKYNIIRYHMNARRYELKASAIDDIWRESEETVGKIIQSAGFDSIIESLFFECVDGVPDNSVVRASPADAAAVKSCIERSQRPLRYEDNPGVRGGVEFVWPDGKVVLKNTLVNRLSRLMDEGNAELSAILFAGTEDSKS